MSTVKTTVTTTVFDTVTSTVVSDGAAGPRPPAVYAGPDYAGLEKTPIQLAGVVTPGDDPNPVILWTEPSGLGGVFADPSDPATTFTADIASDQYQLTLTANPSDGDPVSDTASLDSQPYDQIAFIGSFAPFDIQVDVPITPRDVTPAYTGNATPFTYALTGTAWPPGLIIDENTGIITGTPTVVADTAGHTVTATDTLTNTAVSNDFNINVVAAPVPVEFIGNIDDISALLDEPMPPVLAWQQFNGSITPITYASVGTPLPPGVTLDTLTGVISGTPTAVAVTSGHIVRAIDNDLNTADSNLFAFEVTAMALPILDMPLITTILPTTGTGVPTFTRANGSTAVNYLGQVTNLLNGEIGFWGTRNVKNYIPSSEDISGAFPSDCTIDSPTQFTATGTGGGFISISVGALPFVAGQQFAFRCLVSTGSPTDVFYVTILENGGGPAFFGPNKQVGTTPVIFNGDFTDTTLGATGNGTINVWIGTVTQGATVTVTDIQFEVLPALPLLPAPSEYVSTGVDPGPYDSNVDGSQNFTYAHTNTYDSDGFVTEGPPGRDYDASDFYNDGNPWGSGRWAGFDCLMIYSEDFTQAPWTPFRLETTADATPSPVGNATKFVQVDGDTLAGGISYEQAMSTVIDGDVLTFSIHAKAAELEWIRIADDLQSVAVTNSYVNVSTGTTGTVGGGHTINIEPRSDGFYRVSVTLTVGAGRAGQNFLIYLAEADNSPTINAAYPSGLYVDGVMCNKGAFAYPYQKTEASPIAVPAESLTIPTAGNIQDAAGTASCEIAVPWDISDGESMFIGAQSNGRVMITQNADGSSRIRSGDGVNNNIAQDNANPYKNQPQKATVRWNAADSTMDLYIATGSNVGDDYDGDYIEGQPTLGIGNRNNAINQMNGWQRNVYIYDEKVDPAEIGS